MTTVRQHLEAIRWHMESDDQDAERDLYVRVHDHAVAALALLDNADADLFDETVGMVSLVPDGTAWHLTSNGWTRVSP